MIHPRTFIIVINNYVLRTVELNGIYNTATHIIILILQIKLNTLSAHEIAICVQ